MTQISQTIHRYTKWHRDWTQRINNKITSFMYGCRGISSTPNPSSTLHPFLPPYSLPKGTFRVQPQSMAGGDNTPILHKDSNPHQKDRQQKREWTYTQTDRSRKREMKGGQGRPPPPHLRPPSPRRWNDRDKEEMQRRDEQRRGEENERTELAFIKNKPPPHLWLTSCHCDIFFSSLSHSTDTQMNQPRQRLMTRCHLCVASPFISVPYNVSHTDTHKRPDQQPRSSRDV